MRYTGVIHKKIAPGGEKYLGLARTLLGMLDHRMSITKQNQMAMNKTMPDGTLIYVAVIAGMHLVEIYPKGIEPPVDEDGYGQFYVVAKNDSCSSGYGSPIFPPDPPGTCGGVNRDIEIFRLDAESWSAKFENDVDYGDTSWIGKFKEGSKTIREILTWNGGGTRYGNNQGKRATPNSYYIYYEGEAFTQTPYECLGAAIIEDINGTPFLIAVTLYDVDEGASVNNQLELVICKSMVSTNGTYPGPYNASTNPNGWWIINQTPLSNWNYNNDWTIPRNWPVQDEDPNREGEHMYLRWQHWLFNDTGTEAHCVRITEHEISGQNRWDIGNDPEICTNGAYVSDKVTKQLLSNHYKLTITPNGAGPTDFSVSYTDVGNENEDNAYANFTTVETVENPHPDPSGSCDHVETACPNPTGGSVLVDPLFLDNTKTCNRVDTSKITGRTLWGVDWKPRTDFTKPQTLLYLYQDIDCSDVYTQNYINRRWYERWFVSECNGTEVNVEVHCIQHDDDDFTASLVSKGVTKYIMIDGETNAEQAVTATNIDFRWDNTYTTAGGHTGKLTSISHDVEVFRFADLRAYFIAFAIRLYNITYSGNPYASYPNNMLFYERKDDKIAEKYYHNGIVTEFGSIDVGPFIDDIPWGNLYGPQNSPPFFCAGALYHVPLEWKHNDDTTDGDGEGLADVIINPPAEIIWPGDGWDGTTNDEIIWRWQMNIFPMPSFQTSSSTDALDYSYIPGNLKDFAFTKILADASYFNYLSGGSLEDLTGNNSENQFFYPMGLI